MGSIDENLVSELEAQRQTLTLDEAVRIVEIHRAEEKPGIERQRFESYLDEMTYGRDAFASSLDEILTDAESWQGGGHVYELGDGRVSYYPRRWHDELGDTIDLRRYLRVIGEDAMPTGGGDREAVTDHGVIEEMLLDAAAAIGGLERDHARDQLKELRDEGEVTEYPSQHANPWVQLS